MKRVPNTFLDLSSVWNEREEAERRDACERARMIAAISIQPHVKNRIKPDKLLPLPWDKKVEVRAEKENAPLSQAKRGQGWRSCLLGYEGVFELSDAFSFSMVMVMLMSMGSSFSL